MPTTTNQLKQLLAEQLIDWDREWLAKQPRSRERDHIDSILCMAQEFFSKCETGAGNDANNLPFGRLSDADFDDVPSQAELDAARRKQLQSDPFRQEPCWTCNCGMVNGSNHCVCTNCGRERCQRP